MKNILIVDDEVEIVELLKVYFKNNNFKVFEAYDGEMALKVMENTEIDVIILDIMMPKIDGIQLVKNIRQSSNIPIMFLSAKDEDMDKILGLGVGADDYMTKPFNPLEVIARAQALIRRCYRFNELDEKINKPKEIVIGDLRVNEENCEIFKNDVQIELTSMEYKLLLFLMKSPNRVFTKRQLYEAIWGQEYMGDENIIMVYMSKLRDKIEDNPKQPRYLKTIRGLGYRFERVKDEG